MGSVEPYDTAAGRRYRVRYRDPDRRSRERAGFKTKRAADEYLATVTVTTLRGEYVDPSAARATIGDLGARWLAQQTHLKPSTYKSTESTWRVHVEPVWGRRPLAKVLHSDVAAWTAQMTTSGLSATTIRRAHGILAAILETAVRDRRLASNPARGVALPRKVGKRRAYLTAEQVELLAHESKHPTLVLTLAYTGLRWGEATGLRVSAVNALRRRLEVRENAVAVGGRIIVGTPKSHETRSVPYPASLAHLVAAQCEGKRPDDLVFGGPGHMIAPKSGKGWFWAAVQRARAIDPTFPELTLHDLRHTAASLAISAGANPKAVQRMLGHASAAMTLDTYADLFDDDLDAVSERLDAARAQAVVGFSWGIDRSERA